MLYTIWRTGVGLTKEDKRGMAKGYTEQDIVV